MDPFVQEIVGRFGIEQVYCYLALWVIFMVVSSAAAWVGKKTLALSWRGLCAFGRLFVYQPTPLCADILADLEKGNWTARGKDRFQTMKVEITTMKPIAESWCAEHLADVKVSGRSLFHVLTMKDRALIVWAVKATADRIKQKENAEDVAWGSRKLRG